MLPKISFVINRNLKKIAADFERSGKVICTPGESLSERANSDAYFLAQSIENPSFGLVFLGNKSRALEALNPSGNLEVSVHLLQEEKQAFLTTVSTYIAPNEVEELEIFLNQIYAKLTSPCTQKISVLFIGDCLGREIQIFLTPMLRSEQIQVDFVHLGQEGKTDYLLQKSIREYPHAKYDLIFYSPLTYGTKREYSGLASKRFLIHTNFEKTIATIMESISSNILFLRSQFPDTTLFVHNSGFLHRQPGDELSPQGALVLSIKNKLTQSIRFRAKTLINRLLNDFISSHQKNSGIYLVDENACVLRTGEKTLGKFMYFSEYTHPTLFGFELAQIYLEIINASLLKSKKVIVADLDDTLWSGTIGEGKVEHYLDRQEVLKSLRMKGYLLAISSKNDPRNINWTGGALNESDFVSSRINWSPKSENIRSIANEINLKLKDFVFIDDRPEERALVKELIPEITVMASQSPQTWEILRVLAKITFQSEGADRTRQYQEMKRRGNFLEELSQETHELAMKRLGLVVKISQVTYQNISRTVELINRTNQFNLTTTRIKESEIKALLRDPNFIILVANAKDNFGDLGLVSAAMVKKAATGTSFEVMNIVLSCRVFGFGIEIVLMNAIKNLAKRNGGAHLEATLVKSPYNQPCWDYLKQSGFTNINERWQCAELAKTTCPSWITLIETADDKNSNSNEIAA